MALMLLVEQIKKHEGYKRHPYYCTGGKLTIGYGRNLDDVGLDEEEAEQLLAKDVREAKAGVMRRIDTSKCNEARLAVLVNMAFNLGLDGLIAFKKMIRHIENGNYELASIEMLDSRWAKQVPNRANELAQQMITGEWQ
ncbi:glycoside hydrolase family protein [Pseudoalteromonas sp. SCSIO 43201]|uniref:glycoside hydrolase family protein n=1 Tax=Pseudoalteromonas sp. SCSIO 43201 TaxID=2822842 RepID=UPI002075CBCE|nr:glycoside hydrolase family protein [Pseudoalteromonas sp. SCSIO 43201]USD30894.1 glycoside hydrolase family protein [Pseudoalteromonas sp. SCSIO 43201]